MITGHLREPLYRNAYFLVASSLMSAGFGVVFWYVAARRFSPEAVGLGGSAIAALTLLANLASLNLTNGLNRFVPRAGAATGVLIARAYAIAATLGLVVGVVFLAGLDWWAPELRWLRSDLAWWFPLAVSLWVVFVIQDGALAGLRAGHWVATENLVYAVAKLAVLVGVGGLVAAGADEAGSVAIFVAWTAPIAVLVLGVSALLFRRLVPGHAAATRADQERLSVSMITRFVAGDHTAAMLWMGTVSLLPLIILARQGPAAAGYFYLAWSISYVLYLVGRGFAMSILTESAATPGRARELAVAAMRPALALVIAGAALLLAAAEPILRLFGEEYTVAAPLLRWLALGTVPSVVVASYAAVLRAERRVRTLIALQAALATGVLGGTLALLSRAGTSAVGLAWLTTQALLAAFLVVTEFRGALATVLPDVVAEKVGAALDLGRRVGGAKEGRAIASEATTAHPALSGLVPGRRLSSLTDARSQMLVDAAGNPQAVLKVARTARGEASLERAAAGVRRIHGDDRLAGVRDVVPSLIAAGRAGNRAYVVEAHRPGAVARPDDPDAVLVAAEWAHRFAIATLDRDSTSAAWAGRRSSVVAAALDSRPEVDSWSDLAATVVEALTGVPSTFVHGDYWLGNLLFEHGRLSGVLDWDAFAADGPVDLDLVTLLLSRRSVLYGSGSAILSLMEDGWDEEEMGLFQRFAVFPAWAVTRDAALAGWMNSVALNVEKSDRYQPGTPWFSQHVIRVLRRRVVGPG